MATWVEAPCNVITRRSLTEHSQSNCHNEAMSLETTQPVAHRQWGIAEAFDTVVSLQKKALVGHLKCMYFLGKQEIAHTTNFTPLVNLCKSLGATYIGDIAIGVLAVAAAEGGFRANKYARQRT